MTRAEFDRLRRIEHLAWHVCESSEEDATTGAFTVDAADFIALCNALPKAHPARDGLEPAPSEESPG